MKDVLNTYFENGIGIIRKGVWIPLTNKALNTLYKTALLEDIAGRTFYKQDIEGSKVGTIVRAEDILDSYEADIRLFEKRNEKYTKIAFVFVSIKEDVLWYHVFYELPYEDKTLDNFMYTYFTKDFGEALDDAIYEKCPFSIISKDTSTTLNMQTSRLILSHNFTSKEAAVLALIDLLTQEERWIK